MKRITALDAVTDADTYSSAIDVADFQHIVFSHATIALSDQVVKLQGAIGATAPTFSSAKAVDNEWDYVDSIDYQDASSIDGDTGVTFAGADVRQFVANVEGLDWISFHVSTGTAGALTTKVTAYSNE